MNLGDLVTKVQAYIPAADISLIQNAYDYSARVHGDQKRQSGEPYLTHPLAVAGILADMRLDVPAVVTALLHDTIEDTLVTAEDIRERFGAEIAALVDGVTKISRMESTSLEAARAETVRKMFLASAKDIRVLLVKLADRTHNLRTLQHLTQPKQERIAKETLELYAPLAHRLGIYWLKSEFEEASFKTLFPAEHAEIREKLSLKRLEREGYISEVTGILTKRLHEAGIDAEVTGRTKSAYSIYKKMNEQGLKYGDVYDVVAFRVLVDADRECYDALGVVHMSFRPVPGRFRDYVALPKANRYQSLHTTVIGPYGERMEVQIRTHEMHRVAQFGIAAHWRYKTTTEGEGSEAERYAWLRQILEWQQHLDDPHEFLTSVKEDLFAEEVFVFTPKGQVHTFRKGDTAVDFAYRIHSEVGNHCAGARANGKVVPLRYQLQQGDTVEVITTEDTHPSREWLKFVRSPRAREKIVFWIRQDDRSKAVALGTELLERDLGRFQLDLARLRRDGRLADLVKHFDRPDEAHFLEAVGYGRLATRNILAYLLPDKAETMEKPRGRFTRLFGLLERQPRPLVMTEGIEDAMVRFGQCCQPLPGEEIMGFLTRGRGVTVHAQDCPRLADVDPSRLVESHWDKNARAVRIVKLEVTSRDRPALLANVSQAISSAGVNIERAHVRTMGNIGVSVFEVSMNSSEELTRVLRNLKRVAGVRAVKRVFG